MIASHAHRFIFLKTRKTAGTSVEIALSKACGPDDVITVTSPEDEELRTAAGGRGMSMQPAGTTTCCGFRQPGLDG